MLGGCKCPLFSTHTLCHKAPKDMTPSSEAVSPDCQAAKFKRSRQGSCGQVVKRAQCLHTCHLLNILLYAGHHAKDFTSLIAFNPHCHPLSSYRHLYFTEEEADSEFKQLLQIHMVLSDLTAHALNHSANVLHSECFLYTRSKSEWLFQGGRSL